MRRIFLDAIGLRWPALLVAVAASSLIACSGVPLGPSLKNISFTPGIDTPSGWQTSQKPTVKGLSGQLDPTVCCCHVTGTIANDNSVPTHVLITFAAMDAAGQQIGSIVYYAGDLQPGEHRFIEASGFLIPCASINHVNYQLRVTSAGSTVI
ncbi:MAG: FxLYD domain-containing protein [Betaproteobacteria bacterium]